MRTHLCTLFLPWMPVGFRIYEWIFSCFVFFFLYCFIAIWAVLWQFRTQVPLRLGEANVLLTFWTLFIYQNSIPHLNFESSLAKLAGYPYYVPSGIYLSRKENPVSAHLTPHMPELSSKSFAWAFNSFQLLTRYRGQGGGRNERRRSPELSSEWKKKARITIAHDS